MRDGIRQPAATGATYRVAVDSAAALQIGSYNTQLNVEVDARTLPPPQRPGEAGCVPHNLPPASAVFEGRDVVELGNLFGRAGLVLDQAAVHGLGGIGKSEFANQYARAHLSQFRLVWWITADSRQAVGLGLSSLTARLHPMAKLADAEEWAVGWLQENTGWLLILDNVEDLAHVGGLLGKVAGRGRILVTTRRDLGARWRNLGLATMRLPLLERSASTSLLTTLTGLDDSAGAERLAEALGDLPLGLQQAAAYISQHDAMTFDDYTTLLNEEFTRAAAETGEGDSDRRSIAVVWTVTMDAIGRKSPLATTVLDLLAWLAADELPDSVLLPLSDNPRDVADALSLLASYSMISRRAGGTTVHRLVQSATRSAATSAGQAKAVGDLALRLLLIAGPDDPAMNLAGWPLWTALLPHIKALVEHTAQEQISADLLCLRDRAATFQQNQGNLAAAIAEFEQITAASERLLGTEHRNSLTARGNLANALWQAGRTNDAIAIEEQTANEWERLFGVEHEGTLTARANLAVSYRQAGRFSKAIDIQEKLLEPFERIYGAEEVRTLRLRDNHAASYRYAGRFAEAATLSEAVVADFERLLGAEHPAALDARSNLAGSYRLVGRLDKAILIEEQVLAVRERLFDPKHPDTLTARDNLAGSYQQAGRIDDAIALSEQVVPDFERLLGIDHPDTINAHGCLGLSYALAGRTDEAIAMFERLAADTDRLLGSNHPDARAVSAMLSHMRSGDWRASIVQRHGS
jgi:tetratricopeptide (TPR) repeat protein